MCEITNGQLTIKELAKCLISKTLSILKDMAIDEDFSICKYTCLVQFAGEGLAFKDLYN